MALPQFPHADAYWAILKDTRPKSASYGDVHLEERNSLSLRVEEGRLEDISQGTSKAAALRYFIGADGETLLVGSDCWNPTELIALSRKRLVRLPKLSAVDPTRLRRSKGPCPPGRGAAGISHRINYRDSFEHSCQVPLNSVSFDRKAKLLLDIDKKLRELGGSILKQVMINYGESQRSVFQMTTEGKLLTETKDSVIFGVQVLVQEAGVNQTAYEAHGAIGGWEIIEQCDPMKMAREVLERAMKKLKAPPAPCGEFPVVIAASAGGTFVHEAIGHSLEADAVQDGISPVYKGKIGAQVANSSLSIVDDPTLAGYRGSYHFDDEGVVAKPTKLVEGGVLKDYLYDRVTATRDGKESNGHGRRESSLARPIPRMSNLYIEPGTEDPQDIIHGVQKGLLVTRMGGGQVNTATGQFIFEVEEGYVIEDGQPKQMVRDANLLGVGPEALKSITRIGKDLGWAVGTCGKDGQGVPVTDGLPTILISKMLIGGTSQV